MSVYWNKRVRDLSPYVPGEQPRDKRYIKLNTNENPYPPSPATLEAIRAAMADLRLYPDPLCLNLRRAIAERYGTRPERVFVGNGSDEILAFAFGAFFAGRSEQALAGGEALLYPDLSYSFYPVYVDLWSLASLTPPVNADFTINTDNYRVPALGVVLANPNAPTSLALSRADILSVVADQEKRGRVVLVDEAYVDFGAESVARDIGDYSNLLVVHTLSKSRSLAGLRVGFALGHEDLIEGLTRIKDSFNSYTLDRLALAGATAAIEDSSYYEAANARVAATRDRVMPRLRALGFTVLASKTNFLFASQPSFSGAFLFQALRERGILVRRFDKPRIADYLRISVGTDEDMDALIAACADLVAGVKAE